MKHRLFAILLVGFLFLMSTGRVIASVVEAPAYVPVTVSLKKTSSATASSAELSIQDAKGGTNKTLTISGSTKVGSMEVWMYLNRSYNPITIDHISSGDVEVEFLAPAGYRAWVNGNRLPHILLSAPQGSSTNIGVSIIADASLRVPAGELRTDNTLGSVLFAFGMGNRVDGVPVGAVEIREDLSLLEDDPADFGNSSILGFSESDDNEIDVRHDTYGHIRQIRTYSVLMDVEYVDTTTFNISYYKRGQYELDLGGGTYPILSGQTPFKVFQVSVDTSAKKLTVKEYFGEIGSEISPVIYELQKNSITYQSQTYDAWVLQDGGHNFRYEKFQIAEDTQEATVTYRLRYLDPSDSNAEVYVADYVYKTLSHTTFGERVELIQKTEDPESKEYNHKWRYFNGNWDSVDVYNYAKLWGQSDFRGNWSWTFYYNSDSDESLGHKRGMPSVVMKPMTDEYENPNDNFQDHVITRYRYGTFTGSGDIGTDDPIKTQYMPVSVKTYWNTIPEPGPVLSETHFKYTHGTFSSKEQLTVETTTYLDNSGSNKMEKTSSMYTAYNPSNVAFYRSKPLKNVDPNGRQQSFAYTMMNIVPGFENSTYSLSTSSTTTGWMSVMVDGLESSSTGYQSLSTLYGESIPTIYVKPSESTALRVVRDGLWEVTEELIYTSSGFEVVAWTLTEYLPNGQVLRTVNSRGEKTVATLDAGKRISSVIDSSGIQTDYIYDNLGRVVEERRHGESVPNSIFYSQVLKREYDAAGRLVKERRYGVDPNGTPIWDTPAFGEEMISSTNFDMGGQVESQILPCGSSITYNWILEGTGNTYYGKLETTRDSHTTWTRWHRSGKVREEGGVEMATTSFTYTVTPSGSEEGFRTVKASVSAEHFSETTTDWVGRTVRMSESGPSGPVTATYSYHGSGESGVGQLAKLEIPGLHPQLFEYDDLGRLFREGIKVGTGESLTVNGTDRIVEYDYSFEKDASNVWWATTTESIYPESNSATKVQVSKVQERLNEFSSGLRYQSRAWGLGDTSPSWTTAWVNTTDHVTTVLANYPHIDEGSGGVPERTHSYDGMLYWAQAPDQRINVYHYDHLRRLEEEEGDLDQKFRYSYKDGTSLLEKTEQFYQQPSASTADWVTIEQLVYTDGACGSGRVAESIDAEGRKTHYRYNARGLTTAVFGTTVPTVVYDYDNLGRQTTQYTYASAPDPDDFGDASVPYNPSANLTTKKTTWTYYPWGNALEKKTYPDGKFAKWEYNALGQEQYYQSPRLSGAEKIEKVYTAFGELQDIKYPAGHGMTDIEFTYNRHGDLATVTDTLGTREFEYDNPYLLPSREFFQSPTSGNYGGLELDYGYDSHGRPDTFTVGTMQQSVVYNPVTGRIQDIEALVGGQTHIFSYGYESNSNAVNMVSSQIENAPKSFQRQTGWNRQRALPTFYRNVNPFVSNSGDTPIASDYASYAFSYHNKLPRISSISHTGRIFRAYGATGPASGGYTSNFGYDSQDRLTYANSVVHGTSTSLQDRYFSATLDNSGNRKTSQDYSSSPTDRNHYYGATTGSGGSGTTGANANDQYRHVQGNSRTMVTGEAPNLDHYEIKTGGVTIPRPAGDYFSLTYVNSSATVNVQGTANLEWLSMEAPHTGGSVNQPYFIPKKEREFTYDFNGNLTSDRVFVYTWDLEDRLVKIEHTSSSTAHFRKEFRYDYMSRRVEEVYSVHDGSNWVKQYTRRFVYDGFTMVAELKVPTSGNIEVERHFVWGQETAAGGIGALLLIQKYNGTDAGAYYPGYDGRGSVTLLVDAEHMTLAAALEYGSWGEIVRATGRWQVTPFQFDTKWNLNQGAGGIHWPIGLYDYGLRMYSSVLGRFINRDPIGEEGGVNLYQAFGGDPVNKTDYLGMAVTFDNIVNDKGDDLPELPLFRTWGFLYPISGNAQKESPPIDAKAQGTNTGSTLGNALRNNIPYFGPILGALGDTISGVVNTAVGVVSLGQSGTFSRGLSQFGNGLSSTIDITVKDAFAGAVGLGIGTIVSTATWGRDAIGSLANGDLGGFGRNIGGMVFDIPIPEYGWWNGWNWGEPQFGANGPNPINQGDAAGFDHDFDLKDSVWIERYQYPSNGHTPNGIIGGVYGILGTGPFKILNRNP